MRERGLIRLLFGALLFCLCMNSSAIAAQSDLGEVMIAEELRILSAAVENLAKQMSKQADSGHQDITLRKLNIAIAYLNFRSRRIEMLERDLQSIRSSRNRLDDVLDQFQREEESLPQVVSSNQQEAVQATLKELNFRRQTVKDRISRLEEERILVENQIMDMQRQIDTVEEFVQKNLEF